MPQSVIFLGKYLRICEGSSPREADVNDPDCYPIGRPYVKLVCSQSRTQSRQYAANFDYVIMETEIVEACPCTSYDRPKHCRTVSVRVTSIIE